MPHSVLPPTGPKILFLDAYDSFSNNIIALLTVQLCAHVTTIKIDDSAYRHSPGSFATFLQGFDAVVAGPGPGSPMCDNDVGIMKYLWSLAYADLLPVLGICLGFQSLAYAFGAHIRQLKEPKHGVAQGIQCKNADIFESCEGKRGIASTQYHSLHAQLNPYGEARTEEDLWNVSTSCPDLLPLAWVAGLPHSCHVHEEHEKDDILMAVRHRTKPFWGVQFHPESICSQLDPDSNFIKNWWNLAQQWSKTNKRVTLHPSAPSHKRKRRNIDNVGHSFQTPRAPSRVDWTSIPLGAADTVQIMEALQEPHQQSIVLESGMLSTGRPVHPETGRFTVIGVLNEYSKHLEYRSATHEVTSFNGTLAGHVRKETVNDIFSYLRNFMGMHSAQEGPKDVPFWGGLVGFMSYEACLGTINVSTLGTENGRPDMAFVFVERSIVIDHVAKELYIQSVGYNSCGWLVKTEQQLKALTQHTNVAPSAQSINNSQAFISPTTIQGPKEHDYRSKVLHCQSKIQSGESYELCLTDTTQVTTKHIDAWSRYRSLRRLNAAPFSAYFSLITSDSRSGLKASTNTLSLLSSSPERFMSWTRPKSWRFDEDTIIFKQYVQFRPIKGTLRKIPSAPVTRDEAYQLLNTPKERAENIMIVDLIRHDLHGVVGAGNVEVTKLCSVEEYETVWQLVSVIEGTITNTTAQPQGAVKSGWDIIDDIKRARRSHEQELPPDQLSADSLLYHKTAHPSMQPVEPYGPTRTQEPAAKSIRADDTDEDEEEYTSPIDVLAASLPPGSMTGAPKKRSCEILQQLEGQPRGIYSGVLGYLDVGGGGDFSVLIRTAWHWGDDVVVDQEHSFAKSQNGAGDECFKECNGEHNDNSEQDKDNQKEIWHIGAGGAVTSQSTDHGEWEEMLTKRAAVLRLFTENEVEA